MRVCDRCGSSGTVSLYTVTVTQAPYPNWHEQPVRRALADFCPQCAEAVGAEVVRVFGERPPQRPLREGR